MLSHLRALVVAFVLLAVLAVALSTAWSFLLLKVLGDLWQALPDAWGGEAFLAVVLFAIATGLVLHFLLLARALRTLDGPAGGRWPRVLVLGVLPVGALAALFLFELSRSHFRW